MILIKWTWLMNLIGYRGLTIGVVIFHKYITDPDDAIFINHERIHIRQQLELLFVFQWLFYVLSYSINRLKGMNHREAYRNNIFEQEAYGNEHDLNYLKNREFMSWLNYI